jgi:hypothetical protein
MRKLHVKPEKNNDTSKEGLCVLLASEFSSLNIQDGGGCFESNSLTEF